MYVNNKKNRLCARACVKIKYANTSNQQTKYESILIGLKI